MHGGKDPDRKQDVPFELRVLEALLDETSAYFELKSRRVALTLNSMLSELEQKLKSGVVVRCGEASCAALRLI